ncbi:MAG: hypothetical protein R2879_18585 [Saprospiraceae bacterium]
MKREIIWNSLLILLGILSFQFYIGYLLSPQNQSTWNSILGSKEYKMFYFVIGLAFGLFLIILRYILKSILAIKNPDGRMIALILFHFIPLILIIGLVNSTIPFQTSYDDELYLNIEKLNSEVNTMRQLGLFKSFPNRTDQFVTQLIIGRTVSEHDGYVGQDGFPDLSNKMELMRLDYEKVLPYYDTEFVVEGNNSYVDVIKELAHISEGNFLASNIKETWIKSDSIVLSFTSNENVKHSYSPFFMKDWADMHGLIGYINCEILSDIDYKFYYGEGGDFFVIGMTEEEEKKIAKWSCIEFWEILLE